MKHAYLRSSSDIDPAHVYTTSSCRDDAHSHAYADSSTSIITLCYLQT